MIGQLFLWKLICYSRWQSLIRSKLAPQILAAIVQARLDGPHRTIQNVGYFLQVEPIQVKKDDDDAVRKTEGLDSLLDDALQFLTLQNVFWRAMVIAYELINYLP